MPEVEDDSECPASPTLDEHEAAKVNAADAVANLTAMPATPAKILEGIGLGITAAPATPDKELSVAPPPDAKLSEGALPVVTVDPAAEPDIPPPLPPPKPERAASRHGVPRGESRESLHDVELSRAVTPVERVDTPVERMLRRDSNGPRRASNPMSTSVSSLHSVNSSAQSPTRPMSARPRMPPNHSRRSSTATTLSLTSHNHSVPGPQLSAVLITPPLQVLVNSKEARKSPSFHAAAQKALDLCQAGEGASNAAYLHPREIFEPLRLAISNPQTTSVPILITSLDLLSKLVSHSFFSEPDGPPRGSSPLPDLITHTITLSYSESSPPQVALQVVKALMAIVLSTDKGMLVHQSSLLKAVRTVYNVFLLSNDAANQVVAQGGLTQMVHHVFGRVVRPDAKPTSLGGRRSSLGENEARRKEADRPGAEDADGNQLKISETPGESEPNGTELEGKMTL